jgi:hypothetical protein
MAPRRRPAETAAIRFDVVDSAGAISAIAATTAAVGGRIRTLATVRPIEGDPPLVEIELEVEGVTEDALVAALEALDDVRTVHRTRALGSIFGKRIIVVGGGAQVAQVALGAVSEADRHNLRGERISVDTIPLVGEPAIAAAVRAVADLPRARGLDHGRGYQQGRGRAAGGRHPDHRAQHGRLDHGACRPGRERSGPGRHDGRDGRGRHGHVRPGAPARPAVLAGWATGRAAVSNGAERARSTRVRPRPRDLD